MKRAMQGLTIATLLAGAIGLGSLQPASAVLGGECGGTWIGSNACTFVLAGPHFSVSGTGNTLAATVSVWVRVVEPTSGRTLFSCASLANSTAGPNYASCDASNVLVGPLAILPAGASLVCRVSGSGYGGNYHCSSGTL